VRCPSHADLLSIAQTGKQKPGFARGAFQSDTDRCFGCQQVNSFDAIVFVGKRRIPESLRTEAAGGSGIPFCQGT
jgi:hypothetical protein